MSGDVDFATAAITVAEYGLVCIPVGGSDGKSGPLVSGFGRWKRPLKRARLIKLGERFSTANPAILCGPSGLTVIDIDVPAGLEPAIAHFGVTPLIVRTPRGNWHLYYRSAGESCASWRERYGLPVDIKANGGYVVAPPGRRPDGNAYKFHHGDWKDLGRLPTLALEAVEAPGETLLGSLFRRELKSRTPTALTGRIPKGQRNDTLFKHALKQAPYCDTLEALEDCVRTRNEECVEPLPDPEISSIAGSAWKYEIEGRNFHARPTLFTTVSLDELVALGPNADATLLYAHLKLKHRIDSKFAIAARAMASARVIGSWSAKRYRNATATLIRIGLMRCIHHGGRGPGDPSLYRLVRLEPRTGTATRS